MAGNDDPYRRFVSALCIIVAEDQDVLTGEIEFLILHRPNHVQPEAAYTSVAITLSVSSVSRNNGGNPHQSNKNKCN